MSMVFHYAEVVSGSQQKGDTSCDINDKSESCL